MPMTISRRSRTMWRGTAGALAFLVATSVTGFAPAQWADDPAGVPRPPAAEIRPGDADDSGPLRRFVYLDEDFELNDQVRKAEFFEAQGNWTKAFQVYHQVLRQAKETTLVRLDDRTFGNLRTCVCRRLASMPPERLHQYRLLYDGQAQRLLAEALTPLSPDLLEQVATQYFATAFGDEALDILGDVYRERGEYRRAVARWRQVLEVYPDTDLSRPLLWVKVLRAYEALGEKARATEAAERLRALTGENATVSIAGVPTPVAAVLERAVPGLAVASPTPEVDRTTWPQVGGTAAHVAVMPGPGPADVRTWTFPLPAAALPRRAASPLIPAALQGRAAPPALLCPVTAGGRVFVHDRQAVYAIETATGRLVWSHKATLIPLQPTNSTSVARALGIQASNLTLASTACSVADGRVFAVLGGGGQLRPQVVALDVESGRLAWSSPVPSSPSDQAGPVLYTSEVVVSGGTVFLQTASASNTMAAQFGGGHLEHHVAAFDARSGKLHWNRFVCVAASLYWPFGGAALALAPQLSVPAADEQRVYVSTDGGAVAALDARTGEVVWAALYEKAAPDKTYNANILLLQQRAAAGKMPDPPWRSSVPLVVGDRVVFAPADAEGLYCLETQTGRLLWQRPRAQGQFVVGAPDGRLFVVGKAVEALQAPDAAAGLGHAAPETLWRSAQPGTDPTGHPFLTETALFVPTEGRLYRFDVRTGKVVGTLRFDARDPAAETGNLVWAGSTLVTASATGINGFGDRTQVMAQLNTRLEANPRDAEALFQMGEIHARSEEHELAIRRYEQGLAVCPSDIRYQDTTLKEILRSRLYEHHLAATESAVGRRAYQQALTHATAAVGYADDDSLRLTAKLLLVRSYEGLNRWSEVAGTWQGILLEEPRVEYELKDGSSTTAGVHARQQLEALLTTHGRGIYAAHEAAARRLLEAGDRPSLERILAAYPNSLAYLPATLALGDLLLKAGDPRHATTHYQRYLRQGGETDRTRVYVRLVEALEELGRPGSAQRALDRLLEERPADRVSLDGRDVDVRAYVAAMRARPGMALVARPGQAALPDLALPLDRAWSLPSPAVRFVELPAETGGRKDLCFISGATLACVDGRTGKDRWQREVPGIAGIQQVTGDEASILVADNVRVACLSRRTGQVEWVRSLPEPKEAAANDNALGKQIVLQAAQGGVVQVGVFGPLRTYLVGLALSDQGALLLNRRIWVGAGRAETMCDVVLLDRATGQVLWNRSLPGQPQARPFLLEETALICLQNPNRVLALEIDDGGARHEWKFDSATRLLGVPLVLSPDVVCVGVGNGMANDAMALDLHTGGTVWKTRINAKAAPHQPLSLERRGGLVLYLPRRDAATALDAATGKVAWSTPFPADTPYQTHVVASDEGVFAVANVAMGAGKQTVRLTRIDTAKGGVAWTVDLPETGQVRDVALSAEHLVVAMSPQRATTRQIGQRQVTSYIGLPPQVFCVNQDDGRVEAVLKTSDEGADARFTYQPAWLSVGNGFLAVSHYGGLVGYGPKRKER